MITRETSLWYVWGGLLLLLIVIGFVGLIVYSRLFTLVLNRPEAKDIVLSCVPRSQNVRVGQEVIVTASGGTQQTDYIWITPGNTLGVISHGSRVRVRYPSGRPSTRQVAVVRGTQKDSCTIQIVP